MWQTSLWINYFSFFNYSLRKVLRSRNIWLKHIDIFPYVFPKRLKQAVVKSRINDDSDDYLDEDNSDHRDNSAALLPTLPTPFESHLLVFILLCSFLSLNLWWFYDSSVTKRKHSTWCCVALMAIQKYRYSLFSGFRSLILWEAILHSRNMSSLRLLWCKKFKLPRWKVKYR